MLSVTVKYVCPKVDMLHEVEAHVLT